MSELRDVTALPFEVPARRGEHSLPQTWCGHHRIGVGCRSRELLRKARTSPREQIRAE